MIYGGEAMQTLLKQIPSCWAKLIDVLHDEAGLKDEYSDSLKDATMDFIAHAVEDEVHELLTNPSYREELLSFWQEEQAGTKVAAASTAARQG